MMSRRPPIYSGYSAIPQREDFAPPIPNRRAGGRLGPASDASTDGRQACAPLFLTATLLAMTALPRHRADPDNDRRAVAALDTAYQAAVERNDAKAMAKSCIPT